MTQINTALLEQLMGFQPDDDDEKRSQTRIVEHVRGGGDLFDRNRWDGHLTASAFIVDANVEHILLLLHKKLGKWLQPGGHGEPGEIDPLKVALREAHEETSLSGLVLAPNAPSPFDLDVHEIPARPDAPAHEHLDIRYLLTFEKGSIPKLDPNESHAWAWVPLAGDNEHPSDHSVLRACVKIQKWRSRLLR